MPFIARRGDNSIYGIWSVRQTEGQEELPDDHADVVAFRAPKPPVDQSDLGTIEKRMKVLALCVAQVGGLTPAQMNTLFKQKFDALP